MKIYTFDEQEIRTCREYARWRASGKTNFKSNDDYWTKGETPWDQNLIGHLRGVVGEYAVSKVFGGCPDFVPRLEGDKHKPDIVIGYGKHKKLVAVKTAQYDPPIFKICGMEEIVQATHIVNCHFDEPAFEVHIHWMKTVSEFVDDHYMHDFGYGMRMCLD